MFTEEQLLDPQFDEGAYMSYLLHVSSANSSSSAAEQARLKRCMDTVMSRIKHTFGEDVESLVAEVKATYTAQQEVEDVCRSTESLTHATNRLRVMIEEPYLHVQQRVLELQNTSAVAEALEAVQKLLSLCARLKHYQPSALAAASTSAPSPSVSAAGPSTAGDVARVAAPQELLRDARTLKDIERLFAQHSGDARTGGFDLREVDVVAAQMKTMEQASTAIRGRVRDLLSMQDVLQRESNESRRPAAASAPTDGQAPKTTHDYYSLREDPLTRTVQRVSLALHCARILGSLPRTCQQFMAERKRDVIKSIVRDLDPQRITDEVASQLQNSAGDSGGTNRRTDTEVNRARLAVTQDVLLARIQQVLFAVVQQSQCVLLFWSVLLEQEIIDGTAIPSAGRYTTCAAYPSTSALMASALSAGPSPASAALIHAAEHPTQLLADFWQTTMEKMREALQSLPRRAELQVALVSNYPRYHRVLEYFLGSYCATVLVNGSTAAFSAASPSLPTRDGEMTTRACHIIQQHLVQCGMGDLLFLLQVVESEGGRGVAVPLTAARPSTSVASVVASVRQASQAWARDVSSVLEQRFTQQVMEHHRQRLNAVLSALNTVTPASAAVAAQLADVRALDLRSPSVPAAANALQVQHYTQLILSDVQSYHHDKHTVCLLLRCATRCLGQLSERLKASRNKYPLPPLPAINASVTRGQLMHVCIANACTTLSLDITTALSVLPTVIAPSSSTARASGTLSGRAGSVKDSTGVCSSAGSGADGSPVAARGDDDDDDSSLVALRGELWELAGAFREVSEWTSQPFMRSLHVTLGNALAYCVAHAMDAVPNTGATATAAAHRTLSPAVVQLRDQLTHFASHVFFLFDPRTSEWSVACRDVSDALVARLLAALVTAPGGSSRTAAPAQARLCWQGCLSSAAEVLCDGFQRMQTITVGGGVRSRRSLLLRGAVQQVCAVYAVTDWSSPSACAVLSGLLQSLAPLLALLILGQQAVAEASAKAASDLKSFTSAPLALRLAQKDELVIDTLERQLLTLYDRDNAGPAPSPRPSTAEKLIPLASIESALQTAFDEAVMSLTSGNATPVASTLKTLRATIVGTAPSTPGTM